MIIQEEVTLLIGEGPFEVSGDPSSFAVVWVERASDPVIEDSGNPNDGMNDNHSVLNVALFEGTEIVFAKKISDHANSQTSILLNKDKDTIVICWQESAFWKLAILNKSPGDAKDSITFNTFKQSERVLKTNDFPLALSLREGKIAIIMNPDRPSQKTPQEQYGTSLSLPGLTNPALVEIDAKNFETRILYQFSQSIESASLSSRDGNWTLLATESDSKNLFYTEIDPDGKAADYRFLSALSVKNISPVLKEMSEKSFAGWIEGWPARDIAILGLLSRGDNGTLYSVKELSSRENNVKDILLSEGKGIWTIWTEEIEGKNKLRIMALDLIGNPVCLLEIDLDENIKKFWILEEGAKALLFKQIASIDSGIEKSMLTVQEIHCHALDGVLDESIKKQEVSALEGETTMRSEDSAFRQESMLGGGEDPCDGYDNDSDGTIDEGCDLICDNPEMYGAERRITNEANNSFKPSLVWTGSEYGMSWYDYRNGNGEIYFARANSSGNKIGSDIRVTSDGGLSIYPCLVWNGNGYGISWRDTRDSFYEIYFARLDESGTKIGSDVRLTFTGDSDSPSLVWNGSVYGAAWHDTRTGNNEIFFTRLDSAGSKIGSDVRVTNEDDSSEYPSLVWNGSGYAITWQDDRSGLGYDIYFTRLNSSGTKITSDVQVTDVNNESEKYSSLVWNGSGYGVSWQDERHSFTEIYFARLNTGGGKIGSDVRVTETAFGALAPSLTWTGNEYGISWQDDSVASTYIYLSRLDSSGNKIGLDLNVPDYDGNGQRSSIVWNGAGYGIAWDDNRFYNLEIYFVPIQCCDDGDIDGYTECEGDSNDADPDINPDATEICDGLDNDSDGSIDEICDTGCDNPEKAVSDLRITSNANYSYLPSLAWTGSEYGVSWYDDRDGNDEIYFARFDPSGTKIGSDVRVTNNNSDSHSPSLVWAGSEYGISWNDYRDGNSEIYFARYDASGTKIGSDTRVTNNSSYSINPSLVWTGSEYGISWDDNRTSDFEIYFTRLDSTANKIGPDVRVSNAASYSYYSSLAWTGSEYGVSWYDGRDGNDEIYFARLDSLGTKIGSEIRVTNDPSSSDHASLVWTGSEYGISWHDGRDGNWEIYFARLDSSGSKIGSDVRVSNYTLSSQIPSLVWAGSEYGVFWFDNHDGNDEIYFARLNPSGTKIGSDVRVTNNASTSTSPSAFWNGNGYGVSWQDNRDGNDEIYFAPIRCCDDIDGDGYTECAGDSNDNDPSINPDMPEICDGKDNDSDGLIDEGCDDFCTDPERVDSNTRMTNDPSSSQNPSMVWTGSEYAAVWRDQRDGNDEIYFARMNSSGSKLGSDIRLTSDTASSSSPSIIWTGSEYGVSWYDDRDGNAEIYFARIDSSGSKIGSDIRVTNNSSSSSTPSLVWTGSEYGISWEDLRNGNWEIYFTRIDASGNKPGADSRITEQNSISRLSSLVWTGSEYGVTWEDARDGNFEIYFARLDSLGNKIGSDIRVTSDGSISYSSTLIWSESNYAVSWHDLRDGNNEIYFVRLDSSGSKIGSDIRVTQALANSVNVSLVTTGNQYGLSWRDQRDGNYEIYFATLDSSGAKIGSDIRLTFDVNGSDFPSIVWTGNEYGISWEDYQDGNWEIYFTQMKCCDDTDSDGYSECAGDTNDQDAGVNPDATETCDGKDNDSDGTIDEGCDNLCDNPENIGSDVRVTSDAADSNWPSVVWTGDEYGVSWHDDRDGQLEIYFARLDSDGSKIGSDVRVTNEAANSSDPSLVWTGSEYGVSWRDYRHGNWEIYFCRLSATGSKINVDVRITADSSYSTAPSLVWAGNEYGISWNDIRDGSWEIYFARLDSVGNKIGSDIRITYSASDSWYSSLAWASGEFGIAWRDNRDANDEIYFARLDAHGNKIGSDTRVTNNSSGSYYPSLAWSGGEYGIAWQDFRDGNYEIYFARLDSSGSKIGSDLRVTEHNSNSAFPLLTWSGSEYGLTWYDERDGNQEIYFARIDSSGSQVGLNTRITNNSSSSENPTIVWSANEYGVTWRDHRDGAYEIYFTLIDCCDDLDSDGYTECENDPNESDPYIYPGAPELCDGKDNDADSSLDEGCDTGCDNPEKTGADARVTLASLQSSKPSLVWTGSEYGVSYEDERDGNYEIYFSRLNSSGSKIGSDVRVTYNDSNVAYDPSMVWTGSEYGIAWEDERDGNYEIYFARLDSSGNKIGSDSRVTNNSYSSNDPSLIWTGSEYGVSWYDHRNGNNEIYFARLDSSGIKVGSDIRVTNNDFTSENPSLVWTGSEYGVSWHDNREWNYEIYFARLDASGSKIGSDVRVTNDDDQNSEYVSLVWNGGEYGISWSDNRDGKGEIYFARLDSNGSKIGSDVRVTNDNEYSHYPSLVWSGSEYGVSWRDVRDGNYEIYFAHLNSSGGKIGPDVRVTNNTGLSHYPSLAWSGSEYGVSWRDNPDGNDEIYFATIDCCDDVDGDGYTECAGDSNDSDPDINPDAVESCDGKDNNSSGSIDEICDAECDNPEKASSDLRITNFSGTSSYPSLVWTGNEYGVSWRDDRNANNEIYFARLDSSGSKIGSDVRVTSDASSSQAPSLAWSGSEYGVSWNDSRDGNAEIYFARLDSSGNKIGTDVRVTNNASSSLNPSLVWSASEYGVSWRDWRDGNAEIYFARLDSSGKKIATDIRVTNNASGSNNPSLVWSGIEYGVAWCDLRNGNYEIYFARLDSSGNKIGSDVRVTNDNEFSDYPSLVWSGSEYGVSWEDYRDGNDEIYFARLDSSGVKIGTDVRVTNNASDSFYPSLVWSGSEFGVSWEDYRDGDAEIYLARIDSSGNKIGSDMRVTNNALDSKYCSLVWNGSEYGVSWEDERDGNYEIYFASIRCCDDLDGDSFTECAGDDNDADPNIFPGAQEICDGKDNDSDGSLDEDCDGSCDDPQKYGSDIRVTSSTGNSYQPSSAWNGTGYGIAWHDYRDGNNEIYFADLDPHGNKIGSDIRITSNSGNSQYASLVWTGMDYGISWWDNRDGNAEIYFARLDSSGSKIGNDIRITYAESGSYDPSLVWTGSEFGISWYDDRHGSNSEIYFVRLDPLGNKIGSDERITNNAAYSVLPSLVWTGSGFGITWDDSRHGLTEIYFVRLDSSGSVISSETRVTAATGSSEAPSLTWTGGNYGIAWQDSRDGNNEIYFARMDSSGSKIGSDIRVTSDTNSSFNSSLKWNGSEYGITWIDGRDANAEVYFAHLDSSGSKIASDVRLTFDSAGTDYADLVITGTEYAFAWQDYRDGNYEIYFAPIWCCEDLDGDGYTDCAGDFDDGDPDINPSAVEACDGQDNNGDGTTDEGCDSLCDDPEKLGADVRISNGAGSSTDPSLVWASGEYGVAWDDYRDTNYEIYFARFDSAGNKIGSDVRMTNAAARSLNASLVWTGSEYGLAWDDDRDGQDEIYFTRLDSSGSKIGSDIRVTYTSTNSKKVSIVWTGHEYAMAWDDLRHGSEEVYFTRLDASGNKISPDMRITYVTAFSAEPSLVWTGSEYGVAWYDYRDGNKEIYFARLDSSGAKAGSDTRLTFNSAASEFPRLVWKGSEYAVAWHDYRDGNYEIYFARINSSGSKIGSDVRVTSDSSASEVPTLYWSSGEYGVSWHDSRDGNSEVYFTRLNSSGSKISGDIRVTSDSAGSVSPSLIWTGNEYAVSWEDSRDGNSEIYFVPIECCDDTDSDGYTECAGDTNDADSEINPAETEICDGKDNDSDGTLDEACDGSCDDPQKWSSDERITFNSSVSEGTALAWNGTEFGAVWEDDQSGVDQIYFARIDSAGNMIGSEIRITYQAYYSRGARIIWTGSEYGLSWRDTRDGNNEIYFTRLDSSGSKIGGDVRVTSNSSNSYTPSLVWAGSEYGIAWMDDRDGNWEMYFARLDASGNKLGSDIRISYALQNSWTGNLVWNGNGYGLAYQDERDGNMEYYFSRLDSFGNRIGAEIRVTNDPDRARLPRMVWADGEYGLTWYDDRDGNNEIYFARLDSSGTKIGSDVRVTYHSSITSEPHIAWNGTEYTLTYLDNRNGNFEIYLQRMDTGGNKVGSDLRITNATGASEYPYAVWTGTGYGISWQDNRDGADYEIYFAWMKCCGNDADSDLSNACNDCDDYDSANYPGNTEICDYQDNNCDGTIDEGLPTPGGTTGLAFLSNKQTMQWSSVVSVTGYDVVKGNLQTLISSGGNFTTSLTNCLENDSSDTQANDALEPTLPGEGFYYLVRAQNDCKYGTYNTGQASQAGDRDAEIDSSSNKCP